MTFSIVARCRETGMFGVAVTSSSPAVAARCAHARSGTGAVASQNVTDPALGSRALRLMAEGASATEAVEIIARTAPHIAYRQVLAVDSKGTSAAYSGSKTLGVWAHYHGEDVACGGNLLAGLHIPQTMVEAFSASQGHLGDRLIVALRAGLAGGGEAGPLHSAGMIMVREMSWPIADLRCDWTDGCPIEQLAALWERYKPQLESYVARAIDPEAAPTYGVPGDP